jgi:hypothetical protein
MNVRVVAKNICGCIRSNDSGPDVLPRLPDRDPGGVCEGVEGIMASIVMQPGGKTFSVVYRYCQRRPQRTPKIKQRRIVVGSRKDAEALIALASNDSDLDLVVRRLYGPPPTAEKHKQRTDRASKGICDICKNVDVICHDHCHVTGLWRGGLCRKCNSGLGMFKDSIKNLMSAIDYLKFHGTHAGPRCADPECWQC